MRVLARVLLGLGAFLLVAGILAVTWIPGAVKKTPLDVNTTTLYEGQAAKLDPLTGAFDTKPAYAVRHTIVDSKKSGDDNVIMVENACAVFYTGGSKTVCVNGNDPDLITATTDIFATDRVTALSVDDKNLPADAVPHKGLVNKFPFDVQKKTYPFWDGDVGKAVPIEYVGIKTLFGLDTYEFSYTVKDIPINIADDDPATPEDDSIPGTYDNVVTVYVDPKTGSIVKSGQDQQQFLEDGTPAADVKLDQTDASVKDFVDDANAARTQLFILLTVLPIVGFVGGLLCLLGGLALILRERSGGEGGQRVAEKPKVGAGV